MTDTPETGLRSKTALRQRFQSNLSDRISRFSVPKSLVRNCSPERIADFPVLSRAAIKILSIVFLKIVQDSVTFRARGLALTVVLAMVPMLALGTAILKGIGISEETQHFATMPCWTR